MTSLVLVPGLAADAVMWRHQLEALRAHRPVVADAHMREASIEDMAASVLRQHPGALVLCGASMGGMVAMEAARQAPERVRGLALLGTNASPETEDMRTLREAAIALFSQGRLAEVIEPNVALAFHPERANDATLVANYLEFVLRAGAEQLIRQNRAVIARPDARAHLPRLLCPVLVLCGDADQLTPPECSKEIAALVPQSELRIIPRCGHMLTMERPREVSAILAAWIARVLA
jgi:pimeloyl-ACP methyl ester carboxylesterase